jgi:RNA polymerase sigma factor (sigma-70 family)
MKLTQSLYSEQTLVIALQTSREETLKAIYEKTFPMVAHFVRQRGGSMEDAKDVFHDGMIVFYEKAMANQLTLTASASTYVMGICKNLWRQQLDKHGRYASITLSDEASELDVAEEVMQEEELLDFPVKDYIEKLGEKCKNLLLSFYYFGQNMSQIAKEGNYSSTHSATVQKFKCLERLRKSVQEAVKVLS